MNHKEVIKNLLIQGELKQVIKELLDGTRQSGQNDLHTNLILLSSQYNSNEKDNNRGILDRGSYRRARAKMSHAATSYINQYEPINSPNSENGKDEPYTPAPISKDKILFVAANPSDVTRLQTDREYRIIKREIDRGSQRDKYEFLPPQFAVTIQELVRAIDEKPEIIHFSGHGSEDGIIISNEDNTSRVMPLSALRRIFRRLEGHTKLVVLNSCYSTEQAEEISKFGSYVVGYNLPVGDRAAISLAEGLYIGLGDGKTFEEAFDDAMIVMETESPKYADRVEVWKDGSPLEL